jgi:hypothetical protein
VNWPVALIAVRLVRGGYSGREGAKLWLMWTGKGCCYLAVLELHGGRYNGKVAAVRVKEV